MVGDSFVLPDSPMSQWPALWQLPCKNWFHTFEQLLDYMLHQPVHWVVHPNMVRLGGLRFLKAKKNSSCWKQNSSESLSGCLLASQWRLLFLWWGDAGPLALSFPFAVCLPSWPCVEQLEKGTLEDVSVAAAAVKAQPAWSTDPWCALWATKAPGVDATVPQGLPETCFLSQNLCTPGASLGYTLCERRR